MLFWHLGNYSLWDDEAIDGLIARSLLENGRAEALIGKNLVGYRDGALLHGMMIEGEPPFCAFAAIPCFGIFGQTPWAARAIPALAGFATACLMLLWAFQVARDSIFYALFCMALLFNTSFFFSFRGSFITTALLCFLLPLSPIYGSGPAYPFIGYSG